MTVLPSAGGLLDVSVRGPTSFGILYPRFSITVVMTRLISTKGRSRFFLSDDINRLLFTSLIGI